ncbi:petrobactin biosynthesis protein AsbD [Metabacillus fastidiosus]|uniref:Petrobactin biosynthesis protein AsbD n=1 Tax=Metabacillus fastidiosus TaxID=1458 RepID=A0ABU6P218_9BACI|nr:petrobactin biosynthesis protein AsbD [Metabacillus fastidiosus]MEC2076198.1 petrobactin biosynthesis protein AsbD [Metabacillus fastidiosus]MED4403402.1 petrobactin biosynthesis protein AsbD [Metabacillus fastidiosus]MED4453998.1 petrobactin biosynthesis protein AsbD [Metabacillus fastidiosus]MED4460756.1 petrobactin biosynthesis protein AsbD [Metabacillus fastidiosus]MED4534662.1 petrobactin biosynthesis protein AsbD [Metabacillus fastidiosus]
MTKQEIIDVIYHILEKKLELPTMAAFHEEARLNEDLYMDSIMVLQLILHLELDLGFKIPDEMLIPKEFRTVGSLASFLEEQQKETLLEESHD